MSEGPSPIVPLILVGVLGLIIMGPTILAAMELVLSLLEPTESGLGPLFVFVVPISLLMFMHFLSWFLPFFGFYPDGIWQSNGSMVWER
ncbi:hypothetical protein LINPERPRIM_LOCUS14372 [Linum perenne]